MAYKEEISHLFFALDKIGLKSRTFLSVIYNLKLMGKI